MGGGHPMNGDIVVSGLTVTYDRRPAVQHLSGRFAAGSLTAIVGPNGAGKSTLVKALVGLLSPAQGTIHLHGLDRRAVGYLPQAAEIDRGFPLSVTDIVAMGAWRQLGALRGLSREQAQRASACLAAVGLQGLAAYNIAALSAGQVQRVLFARLLLQDAPVIVLDEPFTAIDARTTEDLLLLVRNWHTEGRTVIAVLHDLEQVRRHFPQTLLMAGRAIAWGATEAVLSPHHLRSARALAESAIVGEQQRLPGLESAP
jgi:zinc/manganese transport system ATP-binding protein